MGLGRRNQVFYQMAQEAAPLTLVIAGANGGLGYAFLHLLLGVTAAQRGIQNLPLPAETDTSLLPLLPPIRRIYALHRHPAPDLHTDAQTDPRIIPLQIDLSDDQALKQLHHHIEGPVHGIINATGLLHNTDFTPEKRLQEVQRETLEANFTANAINHILLIEALLPKLNRHGALLLASLSARVGSIEDNQLGGWYAYRASKAALNQLVRTTAIELKRLNPASICVALHPGTTDTSLSKPFQTRLAKDKLFSPEFAAGALLKVIAHLSPHESGRFFAWDGKQIPW
ncbi:NAD(P)-dependent dehydrogenase, short-chain alcohol dehydrogenase family [Allopseudospirillum japonicum]|uniref:NAD(P)-dependent dehydrogenase, short-chain alcohol dehydrogenase family n=1 Tax=Allopseudospirillum japonicum TaxID=64971 RepID=A0A1H6TV96_9GAMM|nr:SDR family NAD(P)-dependent oxidoreductase [Allopseudospirillum japonicum]SEI83959.1 NAD(P)-dependent dehydrogenase, short-chain alcohol dehydrogenase family [Allopseudospirillum japonicum]